MERNKKKGKLALIASNNSLIFSQELKMAEDKKEVFSIPLPLPSLDESLANFLGPSSFSNWVIKVD